MEKSEINIPIKDFSNTYRNQSLSRSYKDEGSLLRETDKHKTKFLKLMQKMEVISRQVYIQQKDMA